MPIFERKICTEYMRKILDTDFCGVYQALLLNRDKNGSTTGVIIKCRELQRLPFPQSEIKMVLRCRWYFKSALSLVTEK